MSKVKENELKIMQNTSSIDQTMLRYSDVGESQKSASVKKMKDYEDSKVVAAAEQLINRSRSDRGSSKGSKGRSLKVMLTGSEKKKVDGTSGMDDMTED